MGYKLIQDKSVRFQILKKYDTKCSYCGIKLTEDNFQIDHIVPLRRKMGNCERGKDCIENYNPCCASCNSSKSSMDLEKWRDELGKKLMSLERDSPTYRLAKRFKLIKESRSPIIFHFERYF